MTVMESSARKKFMPYPYQRFGIDFNISSYKLDGQSHNDSISHQRNIIDVSQKDDWDKIEFDVELELKTGVIESVFPKHEHSSPPGRLILTIQCSPTFYRQVYSVDSGCLHENHKITIPVSRSNVRGKLVLKPYLVRESELSLQNEFGSKPGTRLASCRNWEVIIDDPKSTNGGYLNVEYRSFTNWNRQYVRDQQIYFLDTDAGPEPMLWLNIDHTNIKEVMDSKGSTGRVSRIRDLIYDCIGNGVWTKLFLHAAAEVDENGDAIYDWQTAILDHLLPMMYPDSDVESALKNVRRDIQIENNPAEVMGRLNSVLQTEIYSRTLHDHMVKLVEEVMD